MKLFCNSQSKLYKEILLTVWCLLKALTSDPSNTFGMNWDSNCQPSLVCGTTSTVTLTNAPVSEWEQIPTPSFH